jgi:hypothetical protein
LKKEKRIAADLETKYSVLLDLDVATYGKLATAADEHQMNMNKVLEEAIDEWVDARE